ncbi:acyltransferase family protein [Pontibacter toksunensis]|uniref:Acyltransferase family protein n=1 Tax=Pontibacter toksunensis TaxID=1332631 RepID=A0ABW6BPS5_9BACT
MEYYKQLDGLRCLAVGGVLLQHWVNPKIINPVGPGFFGVTLFFVISGFLITEILLKQKDKGLDRGILIKNFFIRRSLRILPIYFLLIFFLIAIDYELSRDVSSYLLTYTFNFWNAFTGEYGSRAVSHLWSLCVEEQFYLIWPFFIILVLNKRLISAFIIITASALFFRFYNAFNEVEHFQMMNYRLTLSCLDSFAIGALFAYLKVYHINSLKSYFNSGRIYPLIIVLSILYIFLRNFNGSLTLQETTLRFVASALSFCILGISVLKGYKGLSGKLLENPNIKFIGQISYGIYLYHLPMELFLSPYLNDLISSTISPEHQILKYLYFNRFLLTLPIFTVATILVSIVSFVYLEKPIMELKKHFEYKKPETSEELPITRKGKIA